MRHCKQCRADAIGTLSGGGCSSSKGGCKIPVDNKIVSFEPNKKLSNSEKIRIAVASNDGNTLDVHFGKANDFFIYEVEGDNLSYVGKRTVPKELSSNNKSEDDKIERIISVIFDCNAVITAKIGKNPIDKPQQKRPPLK